MQRVTTSTLLFVTSLATFAWSPSVQAAKIACVGDSITFGYGLGDANTQSYPAVLQSLLGASHTVRNFGVSGTTLLKNGDRPYWAEANFTASGDFSPDVVIVMLGTNDAKAQNWSHASEFTSDYDELVAHYRALGALVYVAAPPPVYAPGAYGIPPDVLNDDIVPRERQIAADLGAPLVDVYQALSGKPEDFPDTVHPNADGARIIAQTVNAALASYGFGGNMSGGAGGSGQGGRAGNGGGRAGDGGGRAGNDGGRTSSAGASLGGIGAAGSSSGVNAGGSSGGVGPLGGKAGIGGFATSAGASGTSTGGRVSAAGGASASGADSGGNQSAGGRAGAAGGIASGGVFSVISGAPGFAGAGAASMPRATTSDHANDGCGCRIERARESSVRAALLACLALLAVRRRKQRVRA
jgi:lysophospholipase L1-like esterase